MRPIRVFSALSARLKVNPLLPKFTSSANVSAPASATAGPSTSAIWRTLPSGFLAKSTSLLVTSARRVNGAGFFTPQRVSPSAHHETVRSESSP